MTGDLLCPTRFENFIGQDLARRELALEVLATARSKRKLSDMLFYGPPGLGKTSLVFVLANELGRCYGSDEPLTVWQSTGAEFENPKRVFETFQKIPEDPRGVIWLIDEVDGINRTASYSLHTLMTHGYMVWDGQQIGRNPVTIIGTTNHMASVPRALKSRFAIRIRLDYYSPADLSIIATQAAGVMQLHLEEGAAQYIGQNAGGEPRKIIRSILRNAANLSSEPITVATARKAVRLSGFMPEGLSIPQARYLLFLLESPKQKASLNSLAASLMEDPADVMGEFEPYLIYKGYATVGQGGRTITERGKAYLQALPAAVAA